jgi:hypothetical protein
MQEEDHGQAELGVPQRTLPNSVELRDTLKPIELALR